MDPADEEVKAVEPEEESKEPQKKKRKRNRKKKGNALEGDFVDKFQDNSIIRQLGNWEPSTDFKQTHPPTIPISKQFPNKTHPQGHIVEYEGDNAFRITSEEKRELDRLHTLDYEEMRKAAECHRQVRRWAQATLRPGTELYSFCSSLEDLTRTLLEDDSVNAGPGFPTGVSLNHCAAHYTPNPGEQAYLSENDVCKVDIGCHVGGRIVDSAFTVAFNPVYDNLLAGVKAATYEGIKLAGIDARFSEIGAGIQEVMESHEVELDGKTYTVRSIRNLNGHSIEPHRIHAGKHVQGVRNNDHSRMEEGEVYAIETFGSTGRGVVHDDGNCSHYMIDFDRFGRQVPIRDAKARSLLRHIEQKYGTLPWCRRFLHRDGETKHLLPLKSLVNAGIVEPSPPLVDVEGCYIAQYEHTIVLRPTCKEIISKGDDY